MACDYYQLPHLGIQTLHPYVPGKSIEELVHEQGLSNVIKLASNENPLGCSNLVRETLAKLSGIQIATYPTPVHHPLRAKLSKKLGIDENMLTLGNGSDFLFTMSLMIFALHRGKKMLTHDLAFITFEIQAQTLGIEVVKTPLTADHQVDMDALISACDEDVAIIFLANPNNPTGLLIQPEEIKRLLSQISSKTIVVLDEAYYEYAYPAGDRTTINLISDYANLIVTRTFSKAYGLAGLRLGYAIANPQISELLQRVQLPFAINQVALAGAYAALDDENFLMESLTLNTQVKQELITSLDAMKLDYFPSHCNFVTFDCQTNGLTIYQRLLQQGIIVRPLQSYGLHNYLRVSVGTSPQNARFVDTLAFCLSENKKELGHDL